MRPLTLAFGISPEDMALALREIEQASRETDLGEISDLFDVRASDPADAVDVFVLDPTTATAKDVAMVVATFLRVIQRRGASRSP